MVDQAATNVGDAAEGPTHLIGGQAQAMSRTIEGTLLEFTDQPSTSGCTGLTIVLYLALRGQDQSHPFEIPCLL
jgi:hypothetical protein